MSTVSRDDLYSARGDILIKGAWHEGKTVDLYIDDQGVIAAVGENIARKFRKEAKIELDACGAILLPGLINAHTHAAMTLLRGYADDMILQDWLSSKIWPLEAHLTAADVYAGTRLACLEMIRTGTTAFNDMYFFMEETARAVADSGIRAVLSYGFIDLGIPEKREAECRATEQFVHAAKSMANPRIRPAAGPHAVYTCSPEGLSWLAEFSAAEDIGIHVHLSETEREVTDCISQHGKRPPALLDDCGILTSRTVAAHGCWLDRAECALLAKRGTHVAYNPVSNMKLATNRALPYHWLREERASVCIGTDGAASNNNLDLFEEMKTGALLQKFAWNSPTILPATEALALATTGGARALGLPTGAIEPGRPADLLLLERSAPCNTPLHHAASNAVYSCNGNAVTTVLCNGRVLMTDRIVPGEAEILAEAARAAAGLVKRALDAT